MSIDDILNRLEAAEKEFVGKEFLAPVVGHGSVMVRIAGVVCRIRSIDGLPRRFNGWALLEALSTSRAKYIGEASMTQVAGYLDLLPEVRLILLQAQGRRWLSLPALSGDRRFRIEGPVAVQLTEEGLERFETVISRFDGRLFWYERRDPGRDPTVSAYLRQQLGKAGRRGLPPDAARLHKRGLTREEREAYALLRSVVVEEQRDHTEVRLSEALDHAGARLRSYSERGGGVRRSLRDRRAPPRFIGEPGRSVRGHRRNLSGRNGPPLRPDQPGRGAAAGSRFGADLLDGRSGV